MSIIARIVTAIALLVLVIAGAPSAVAHVDVDIVRPADGAMAATPPARVVIKSTEPVRATSDTAQIVTGTGSVVPASVAVTAASGGSRITLTPRSPLSNGLYAVRWSLTGRDGHVVTGAGAFGVGPTSATGSPLSVPLTPTGPNGRVSSSSPGPMTFRLPSTRARGTATWEHPKLGAPLVWDLARVGAQLSGSGLLPLSGTWKVTVDAGGPRPWTGQVTLR